MGKCRNIWACYAAAAWISARWKLAPQRIGTGIHWEDWPCCSFNCIQFSSLLIEWVLRDCASHACVLSTWSVGAGMRSQSIQEYKWIFTDASYANLQTQGEINLKVYSTNVHTSLTSTLYIFSQFWLSKNFLRSSPRPMMHIWEFALLSQNVC